MNKMRVEFSSKSNNESFARIVAAAFVIELDPTLEELSEIKTAVSEAVTNAIIHGCSNDEAMDVYMNLSYDKNFIYIEVIDKGVGILDIELAKTPMFTTKPDDERSGLGFTIMDVFSDEMIIESSIGEGCFVKIIKKIDHDNTI